MAPMGRTIMPSRRMMLQLLLLSALCTVSGGLRQSTKTILEYVRLTNCSNPDQYKNYMANVEVMRPSRDDSFIVTDFVVNEPGSNSMKIKMEVFRCAERTASNCEFFLKMAFPDGCRKLTEKNVFWTRMVESAKPALKCPLLKGTYHISNFRGDTEKVLKLVAGIRSIEGYFWNVRISVHNRKKTSVCFEVMVKVVTIRA